MRDVLVFWASGTATVVLTQEACDRVKVRLRVAYHRRLTRRHGQMLRRTPGGAR